MYRKKNKKFKYIYCILYNLGQNEYRLAFNLSWISINNKNRWNKKKELHRDVNTDRNERKTNAATAAKVNEVISCVIPVAIPIWMTGAEQNGYSRRHRLSHLKIYDRLMTNSLKFIINLIIKSEFEYVPSCLSSFLPFLRHSTIRASRGNRRMPNQTHIPRPLHSHFSCQPRTDSGLAATQTQTAIC